MNPLQVEEHNYFAVSWRKNLLWNSIVETEAQTLWTVTAASAGEDLETTMHANDFIHGLKYQKTSVSFLIRISD